MDNIKQKETKRIFVKDCYGNCPFNHDEGYCRAGKDDDGWRTDFCSEDFENTNIPSWCPLRFSVYNIELSRC